MVLIINQFSDLLSVFGSSLKTLRTSPIVRMEKLQTATRDTKAGGQQIDFSLHLTTTVLSCGLMAYKEVVGANKQPI